MLTENKIKELRSLFDENGAALILSPQNRFYLTGFDSSDGLVLITESEALFMTDSRYIEKAKSVVKNMDVKLLTSMTEQLNVLFAEKNIKTLLVESDYMSVSQFLVLEKKLTPTLSNSNRLSAALTDMRAVKSESELERIKSAQALTDQTFSYILEKIAAGRTEREVMLDMEFYMRKAGSEGVAFDFIVVSGKNSSLPHGVPTDKKIESGDFVTMDFGAVVGGYRSDMTRTVAVGSVSDKQKDVYDTVLKAQEAAIRFAAAGKKCSDVDKAARDIIDATNYKGLFGHALGHSVGIDIHEAPACSPRSKDILKCGTVMTAEPGIYIENEFGVRIEDMLYITENGNINLTKSPKNLIIL